MSSVGLRSRPSGFHPFQTILGNSFLVDLAIDLGTSNILVAEKTDGIIFNEPSLVAVENDNNKPIAIGLKAKNMYGKTPKSVTCVRPLKEGVVANYDMTKILLKQIIKNVMPKSFLARPRVVISVLSGITQVEKRAVIDTAFYAGAKEVHLVEEPMAAALGIALPIDQNVGNMIIDIGGGTTDIAIIANKSAIYSQSIRVAGDVMDEAIQTTIQRAFDLQIGILEAERIKLTIGSALPSQQKEVATAYGRSMIRCLPQKIEVSNFLVEEALKEPISAIIAAIVTALEQTDYSIVRDIVNNGIYLTGGGSLLKGLAERLQAELTIDVHTSENPHLSVIQGLQRIVSDVKENQVYCIV